MAQAHAKLVKDITKHILSIGGLPIKKNQTLYSGVRGISDILACIKGKFFAIECKTDAYDKLTPLQAKFGREVEEAGGIFIVAFSVEDVKCKWITDRGE